MTTTEVKIRLIEVRRAERAHRLARDKAEQFKQAISCGKTIRYENDSSTHVKNSNPVERAYCQLADYEAEADALLDELVKVRKRTDKYMKSLSDPAEREVLMKRYIMCKHWDDIAADMGYTRRRVIQIHDTALKNISLNFT